MNQETYMVIINALLSLNPNKDSNSKQNIFN